MHTLRDNVLEPVVYHLNPAKSDTPLFHKIVGWTPSAISSYAAYAFKVKSMTMKYPFDTFIWCEVKYLVLIKFCSDTDVSKGALHCIGRVLFWLIIYLFLWSLHLPGTLFSYS